MQASRHARSRGKARPDEDRASELHSDMIIPDSRVTLAR
jgi:hypothetical protein